MSRTEKLTLAFLNMVLAIIIIIPLTVYIIIDIAKLYNVAFILTLGRETIIGIIFIITIVAIKPSKENKNLPEGRFEYIWYLLGTHAEVATLILLSWLSACIAHMIIC